LHSQYHEISNNVRFKKHYKATGRKYRSSDEQETTESTSCLCL